MAYNHADPNTVVSTPPPSNHHTLHLPPPLTNNMSLDTQSDTYQQSLQRTLAQVQDLNQRLSQVGGSPQAIERHHARNKLLAKERIQQLVDPGTPLLELSSLVANDADPEWSETPTGAGIVTAVGVVSGQLVVIIANDATVKG